ncbi:outer membrane beta-barrel protein [Mucilaginibacter segetis]|uniref:Outer membrane beta-barrel protein n=1 Tax=Mucilaginibacter segetis TaxID=2793071 RepID=A0A934PVJ8_9SPHI|nr:outer membrane beta-barrel protein [Mucilaginibacter segetis]MBK0380205.1 outer membrane beta-barrel protein [Mucilaginibacter segetis]
MKYIYLIVTLICFSVLRSNAQATREVRGTIIDSTKLTLPGSNIKLTSEKGDSVIAIADANGKFAFPEVKGKNLTLAITSIGYQAVKKHFNLDNNNNAVVLPPIILQSETKQLNEVTIVGVNPVVFKEDTVQYSVGAYKVRENAPIEDVLKKVPGIDVAKDGTITAEGKQVTKVRVNGKDFFGGDVQSATKNLPADVIENIQVIDDYGDQANLSGVKTGEPNKILNFTIRKDKNYGYFGQATAGDGQDALPKNPGVTNDNRYIGLLNFFKFKGDQQISVLGSINNTNVNTFSFGTPTGGGGGFGGGRGGRGNALRGGGSSTTNANGITDARSIGINFRDQWGKTVSVYGSYSFNDNTVNTNSSTLQTNNFQTPSVSNQISNETDKPQNHRFNFNVEWKPDTVNYLKVTPTFSYSGNDVVSFDNVTSTRGGVTNLAYTSNSISNSSAPNFGFTGLYNHRFNSHGRNLSIDFNANSSKNSQYDNPIYDYTVGSGTAPMNQVINTDNRTNSYGANLSYLEPLSKVSFLEFNYAYNHSYTSSNKETDTLYTADRYHKYDLLSNNYDYTFTTNRIGLNYKYVEKKVNYTLGIGVQPATLSGKSDKTSIPTKINTFNVIPTARFDYTVSRSQSLRFSYNGSSNQPSFDQLQPVTDFSNALYPVQGNPNLNPEFTNRFSLRYNNFSFQTGNIFFSNLSYTSTNDKIVASTITYPVKFTQAVLAANPSLKNLQNTNLTQYLNTSGYYQASAFVVYSKPWSERKYTLILNGNVNYTNNIGFSGSVDSNNVASAIEKNIAKTFTVSPGVRFRVNINDIIDAEANTSYSINKTSNSLNTPLYSANTNIRTLNIGLNGKNYFWKDWTLSYDYTKSLNYGYDPSIGVKNPNLLNAYVERRFLKDHRGTLRFAMNDIFNENTGFSTTTNGSIVTQSNVNRLGRYFLLTFTLRLQKFSGKSTAPPDAGRGFRGPGGGGRRPGGDSDM